MHATQTQPTLAGIEPAAVQTPAPAEELPRLAVNGTLAHHAVLRTTTDGTVLIDLVFQQHLAHHPRAVHLFGTHRMADHGSFALTHLAATELVARMRTGADVVVLARGIEPGRHAGEDVLRLLHIDAILVETPAPSTQRDSA